MARMIAHRGLSGMEKENTAAAFVAAGHHPAYYGVETDVHVTADGQYMILHDDNTSRVAGVDMTVETSTRAALEELVLFDRDGETRRSDLRIPALSEYLTICKRYDKVCVIELKGAIAPEHIRGIKEEVERFGRLPETVFISFWLENLTAMRELLPHQPMQLLTSQMNEAVYDALSTYRLGLDAYFGVITPEVVGRVHALSLPVNCWTVDRPEDAAAMCACGVDYITTNILE